MVSTVAKVTQRRAAALALLMFAIGLCSVLAGPKPGASTSTESSSTVSSEYMGLSGEELWSNNCLRCHNIRPPTMYSDAQWDVIVHHMRLRANITGAEQRAIADFLKSASH